MGEESEGEKKFRELSETDKEIHLLTVRGGKLIRKLARRQNPRRAANLRFRLDAIKAKVVELAKKKEASAQV